MEGYGRYIALFIFCVFILIGIYSGYKEDKEELKSVLACLSIAGLFIFIIAIIINYW